jgi:hypothetical protein
MASDCLTALPSLDCSLVYNRNAASREDSTGDLLKGIVQQKLRWVENGVNRSVGASDCGAGHSFVVLFRFHFDFTIFPFPVSTAEFIDELWTNK